MGGRGPFSDKDLLKVISTFNNTGGKVNQIVATAREGTYKALVTKKATKQQVAQAINSAKIRLKAKNTNQSLLCGRQSMKHMQIHLLK